MKIRRTCKLPGELVIGFGYGLAVILPLAALYLGFTYLVSTHGATITGFFVSLGAAIMDNLVLIVTIFIAAICALCGWAEEDYEANKSQKKRSRTVRTAVLISAGIGVVISVAVQSAIQTCQTLYGPCFPYSELIWGFSWLYFMETFLVFFGGFVAGWLGHWCRRCIRIEPDEAPAGGEGT